MKFEQTWTASLLNDDMKIISEFQASVPGNVQYDFLKSKGMTENLQFSDNLKVLEQFENNYWQYDTHLCFSSKADERVFFVAEGIDYKFDIILDGKIIHQQEGMFTPVEIDITETAHQNSLLSVRIYPHPKAADARPGTREEARQSCKPPVSYSWDWNPRCLISGIWKPSYIETRESDYIRHCEPFYELDITRKTADVWFETDCDTTVEYTLFDAENNIVYNSTVPHFQILNVKLWWCNGQGEPYLYHWTAKTKSNFKEGNIGFRTIKLRQNTYACDEPYEMPKSRYSAPITIELNGRRIFAKGSNFLNAELFFGNITSETYCTLIGLAHDANMNILRMWGGSGIQKKEFYEECDRQGIMVWQEFMLACCNYEGTPTYLSVLKQEAESIIKQLRRYACLVLWCGGNELFNNWSGMDEQSYALRLLNKICFEQDMKRPFLMTSPLTGMAHGGYVFREDNGREIFEIFGKSKQTAYCEFGIPSISPPDALQKIIPENELYPIKNTTSWKYHHGFNAWTKDTWCCLNTEEYYFGKSNSLEEHYTNTQWLQSIGCQFIFEEARRQYPYCSMAINWCFNEPWITAANNSVIAYPCNPKPAYYAVQSALRSTLPTARITKFSWAAGERFSAEVWYLNDSPDTFHDYVKASMVIGESVIELFNWKTGKIAGGTNKIGPSVNIVLPVISDAVEMILLLESSELGITNKYRLLYHAPKLKKKTLTLNM